MGIKVFIAALVIGGIGGLAPDFGRELFGANKVFHHSATLGAMAVLLCIGLYLALSRRLF